MAKRTLVIDGTDRGHFFLCVEGGTLSVGDSPGHADIVLRNLRVVAVRCEVEVEDEFVVAGNPATLTSRRELRPGEDLRIGRSHLRFTGAAGGGSGPATTPAAEPEAPAARTGTAPLLKRLLVIDGADRGRAFRLPETGTRIVGKGSSQADIRLNDLYVARMHCAIKVRDDKVYVTHREGANGTLIDGKRITGEHELRPGEVLRVGNSSLRLETVPAEDGPPAHEDSEPVEEDGTEHALAVAEDDSEGDADLAPDAAGAAAIAGPAGPGHPPVDRLVELEGQVLGPYRVGPLLGRGHCGLVFKATHLTNNLAVSLKVLSPDFPATGVELQRFVQAQKVASQVHHANLVTPSNAGRSGTYCWIAREYVEGESAARLVQRCRQRGKFNWARAARVAIDLAKALGFLHQHKLLHGNLTPRNVLVRAADKGAKLADLMLAQSLEGSRLQAAVAEKKLLAELPWMAPEQVDPKAFVDHLADLYGLGAVVYTLLTGQPPFAASSPAETIERIHTAQVVRPTALQRDVPASFERVVLKLLARRQEDRYQSAAELLADLQEIAQEHEIGQAGAGG
jgi:hypothetical protein